MQLTSTIKKSFKKAILAIAAVLPLALAANTQPASAQSYDLSGFNNGQALQSLGARGGPGGASAAYAPANIAARTTQQVAGLGLQYAGFGGLTQIYGIHNGYNGLSTYQVSNRYLLPNPNPVIVILPGSESDNLDPVSGGGKGAPASPTPSGGDSAGASPSPIPSGGDSAGASPSPIPSGGDSAGASPSYVPPSDNGGAAASFTPPGQSGGSPTYLNPGSNNSGGSELSASAGGFEG